jgi:hypothetical protein
MENLKNGRVITPISWNKVRVTAAARIASNVHKTAFQYRETGVALNRLASDAVSIRPLD